MFDKGLSTKLKIYILLHFFTCQFFIGYSQVNLVPNGGFENYSSCPQSAGQLTCSTNWFIAGGSTDYYNACAPQGYVSVPSNFYGFQYAASGASYIGMVTFGLNEPAPPYYREPAMTKLTQTLSIGTKYYVSFKAVLTINDFESCCASNKLGALFSKVAFSVDDKAPINNFAHVYSNIIITDTLNWTTIAGSFISDSAYQYVTIGNFFSSANTSYIDYKNNFPQTAGAYYFIDDVKVSTDSGFVYAGIKTINPLDEKIDIYPNPVVNELTVHSSKYKKLDFNLFDLSGRLLITKEIISGHACDLSFLASGTYVATIVNRQDNKIIKIKLINKL